MAKELTVEKAKKILADGTVRGKKLTAGQRRFFQARADGTPIRRKVRKRSDGP